MKRFRLASYCIRVASVLVAIVAVLVGSNSISYGQGAKRKLPKSRATLRPDRKMVVLEYEVGVEIGSRAFFADSAYKGNRDLAEEKAATIVPNLNRRYLHATGIQYRLGKVIIRDDASKDPLRDLVTATGGGGNARKSLQAFRDYWNSHPGEAGRTHDLACYHVYYAPSGLAYVNSVGSPQRYATVGGRSNFSWADGTLTHEFGHSWGLKHVSDSGFFYESSPRVKTGAVSPGGSVNPISIMVGNKGNIGRMATAEAELVMQNKIKRREFGDLVDSVEPTRPFGAVDRAVVDNEPIVLDVVANDYDVNNDVLDCALFDSISYRGGKVSLSKQTGPGRRNEIRYQPPASGLPKEGDFFHYKVFDSTGRTDFGAVYIQPNNPVNPNVINVDLAAEKYDYDLGMDDSPVLKGFTRLTPEASGDVFWEGEVSARDRGKSPKVNLANRDFVFGTTKATLHHKIKNGRYSVTINMGDAAFPHSRMGVRAEGKLISKRIRSEIGSFPYVVKTGGSKKGNAFEVTVTDGDLELTFFDGGGRESAWVVTRISIRRLDVPTQ